MSPDPFEEDNSSRLRQRLWGAAVLIAIAVIVLPLLLDGAGSESQFRRVEQLREQPTRQIPDMRPTNDATAGATAGATDAELVDRVLNEEKPRVSPTLPPITAWVVLAAALNDEPAAVLLRDQLRRAGFASFIRDREASTDPFRVLVGPMIKKQSAERARERVAALLKSDPVIMVYP